uniref:Large ribosomal subunit protein mL52 n=1 Tax=Aceria tosichella TaxID=561515 RepID=A0A6G1SAW4_9ACAR
MLNLVIKRGLKKIGQERFLQISRYRKRKGLAPSPTATGPLTDDYDWSYPDGTPGQLNRGQSLRYVRDQDFGRTMVDFSTRLQKLREDKLAAATSLESDRTDGHK